MINRVLIVDTETSGLDESAELVEIGMVLYSVTNQTSLIEFSTLLPASKNDAENVNRIKVGALEEMKIVGEKTSIVHDFLNLADCLVAHNADFDREVLCRWSTFFESQTWLCTMADFKWPHASREQGSLINLALDHGIGVASAHRALTDCRLIASLFDRMTDLQSMFEIAMRPKALFQAIVPFERKDEAKAAGFRWYPETKSWKRSMAIDDAKALPFKTVQIETVHA